LLQILGHSEVSGTQGISLRYRCVLCVSAVQKVWPDLLPQRHRERRDSAENFKLASLSFFSD
jgi:hypothetical protein